MNPFLIAALVAQAGSMYANSQAQSKVNDARRNIAKKAKEVRDRAHEGAESARQRNLEGVNQTDADLAKASAARTQKYVAAEAPATTKPSLITPDARGDSAVVNEDARQKAKAKDFTGQIAGARGELDGLGDVFMQSGLRTMETGRDIHQNTDMAGSYMRNVMPYQLQHANTAGDQAANIAQLLQMLSMASMGAAGGYKPNAATPTQTTVPFFGADMPAKLPGLSTGPSLVPPGMTPNNLWKLPGGY